MASGASRTAVGSFYGTGASLDVETVGFRPRVVELYNIDGVCKGTWVDGMADASAVKQVTAGTMSVVTSGGVTPIAKGFNLGADTDLNVSGELVRYVAHE